MGKYMPTLEIKNNNEPMVEGINIVPELAEEIVIRNEIRKDFTYLLPSGLTVFEWSAIIDKVIKREEAVKERIKMEVEKMKKDLDTENKGFACNPYCHDSGKNSALQDIINLINEKI